METSVSGDSTTQAADLAGYTTFVTVVQTEFVYLIWCCCGHGEFLPIEKCARAAKLGYCWTVVWGDHNVVIPSQCSYCIAGLNEKCPLGGALTQEQRTLGNPKPIKQTNIASEEPIVRQDIGASGCGQGIADGLETLQMPEDFEFENASKGLSTSPGELEDILNTEFKDFDLSQELWHYE
ncbi:hypothetical protein KC332_g2704 [Hortaea werneckii]|uniref:Uncharacterized protein n=2 Tax=Hortaea werneckii TaxID=91943 RepID=A0A3M7HUV9_HORWE|nr:hypothetical protein KC358_g1891 [Hortaea werneckii]OTA34022.1 hypothetical protein BTJ68_05534 [Hortaea werneckii EXF-2000]KAI6852246.1 hypothetical protein KC350_g1067 [Hortaea werneckii]KAI6934344.1 hypothetical protein KC341_g7668 [Hortaea werneckii]KAI6948889.1 hypothetical protein KC348_g1681 [Hortaea werneckii]